MEENLSAFFQKPDITRGCASDELPTKVQIPP